MEPVGLVSCRCALVPDTNPGRSAASENISTPEPCPQALDHAFELEQIKRHSTVPGEIVPTTTDQRHCLQLCAIAAGKHMPDLEQSDCLAASALIEFGGTDKTRDQ